MFDPKTIDRKKLSVDNITHHIEAFVASLKDVPPKAALSQLVYYIMGHRHYSSVFNDFASDYNVLFMQAICDINDADIRANLLEALKQSCYKFGAHDSIEDVNNPKYYPASVIAMFQNETVKANPNKMVYTANLAELDKVSMDQLSVLVFCIQMFAPAIVIEGDFANNPKRNHLVNQIIQHCPQTRITFKTDDHQLFGANNRGVFFAAVKKATHLHIDGAELNRWTADDFKHFIYAIKANPNLTAISMQHTKLSQCCKDPSKIGHVLELLKLDQLHFLNLHRNHLGELPAKELAALKEAVSKSPIHHVALWTVGHSKTARGRLFDHAPIAAAQASTAAVATEEPQAAVAVNP